MIENLILKEEHREKKAFYASDFGKTALDLYFSFMNEPKTNPFTWQGSLKLAAGNGVEAQMIKILKDNGLLDDNYNQKEHGRIEIKYKDIQVNGYIDALLKTTFPLEVKSINNANDWDIKKYASGEPRENYVGQLGLYMYEKKSRFGHLFVASIDGLHTFEFIAELMPSGKVRCGNVQVDIIAELERWNKLWNENIVPKKIPDIWEYRYKYPIEEIDWKKVSRDKISKARNNRLVIGDWQISWSPWKNKIIEMQGTTLGYTNEELLKIQELTDGYTTWKKN